MHTDKHGQPKSPTKGDGTEKGSDRPQPQQIINPSIALPPAVDKAGFVLVGCVCYKASFESADAPTHQTRFMYFLGTPMEGVFQPYIVPKGTANNLQLITAPLGFTAD